MSSKINPQQTHYTPNPFLKYSDNSQITYSPKQIPKLYFLRLKHMSEPIMSAKTDITNISDIEQLRSELKHTRLLYIELHKSYTELLEKKIEQSNQISILQERIRHLEELLNFINGVSNSSDNNSFYVRRWM